MNEIRAVIVLLRRNNKKWIAHYADHCLHGGLITHLLTYIYITLVIDLAFMIVVGKFFTYVAKTRSNLST